MKTIATDALAARMLAHDARIDRDSDARLNPLRRADGSPDRIGGSRRPLGTADVAPPSASTAAGRTSRRWLRDAPILWLLALLGVVLVAGPGFTESLAPWPFLISFILLGMPHGAMDLWVAGRLPEADSAEGPPSLLDVATWRTAIGRFGGYLGWMGVSLAMLLIVPDLTIALFLMLTIVHWGLGDQWATQRREMRVAPGWWIAGIFIAARGCLVLGPAFANDPSAAWAPFATVASFGAGSSLADPSVLAPVGATLLVIGAVLAVTAAIWRGRHDGPRGAALFGVGCYFMFVHSWRHAVRLGTCSTLVGPAAARNPASGLLRVHWLSMPLLVPTGCICLVAAWHLEAPPSTFAIAAAMIAFFMVSTLPHHLLGLKLPGSRPLARLRARRSETVEPA
ncbi:MAG: Brp/Blh family beta-carotene 15,15'-dioxygenase [Candidatus Nanopelagicales bacterium]